MSSNKELGKLFKDVRKFNYQSMSDNQKRAASGDFKKVKMPYKMLQGMQKKSKQRFDEKKKSDRDAGIIAEAGGKDKRIMQSYFEKKIDVL